MWQHTTVEKHERESKTDISTHLNRYVLFLKTKMDSEGSYERKDLSPPETPCSDDNDSENRGLSKAY